MKRWLAILFVALLIGIISFVVRATFLEFISFIIGLLALIVFAWSVVKFSLTNRVSKTQGPHRSYTEELHAIIFKHPSNRSK